MAKYNCGFEAPENTNKDELKAKIVEFWNDREIIRYIRLTKSHYLNQ